METVNGIVEICASAAGVIAEMWLLLAWYPRKHWVRKWHIVLWFLVQFALVHFMRLSNLTQSVISLFVSILGTWILLEGKRGEKTLVVVAANIFQILLSMLGSRIVFLVSGEDMVLLLTQGSGAFARTVDIVSYNLLLLLAVYILSRASVEQIRLKKGEYAILAIFYGLFFGISVLSITVLAYADLPGHWQAAFLTMDVLMLVANIVVLRLIVHINKQNRYKLENVLLRAQIAQQAEQSRREKKNNEEIRLLRHDMKRYFVTCRQLLTEGKYELVEQEMDRLIGERLETTRDHYTECAIINAVINEKAERCRRENIAFHIKVNLAEDRDSMDLGIVLSNLVDNAIEAELREPAESRCMELDIGAEQEMLHVIVKNYISQSVLADNPRLKTTKAEKKSHGIGIRSAKEYVRREKGEIEILEQDKVFVVHLCISGHTL